MELDDLLDRLQSADKDVRLKAFTELKELSIQGREVLDRAPKIPALACMCMLPESFRMKLQEQSPFEYDLLERLPGVLKVLSTEYKNKVPEDPRLVYTEWRLKGNDLLDQLDKYIDEKAAEIETPKETNTCPNCHVSFGATGGACRCVGGFL